jgi:hypothetical protein
MNTRGMHQIGKVDHLDAPDTKAKRDKADWRHLEALGLIAGGLAHELNNQITMIGHGAELAEMLDDPGRYREMCRQTLELCECARGMIQRLQAFGRARPGRKIHVDLAEMTLSTVRLLRGTLPAGVELKSEISKGSFVVKANPVQLQEILIHLVSAAAAVMRGREGCIAVALRRPGQLANTASGSACCESGTRVLGAEWHVSLPPGVEAPELWRELDEVPDRGPLAEHVRALFTAHEVEWKRDDSGGAIVTWSCEPAVDCAHARTEAPALRDLAGLYLALVADGPARLMTLAEALQVLGARVSVFTNAGDFFRWLGAGDAPAVVILHATTRSMEPSVFMKRIREVAPTTRLVLIGPDPGERDARTNCPDAEFLPATFGLADRIEALAKRIAAKDC